MAGGAAEAALAAVPNLDTYIIGNLETEACSFGTSGFSLGT